MNEWLIFAFLTSLAINIFLAWYTRSTLYNLLYLANNLEALHEIVQEFAIHLKDVYELERFYGDPTLTHLLEHSKMVTEELGRYEEIFLLSGVEIEENEETQDGQEES